MRFVKQIFILFLFVGGSINIAFAQVKGAKSNATIVVRIYEVEACFEIVQQELKMKQGLLGIRKDRAIVVVKDFMLAWNENLITARREFS